MDSRSWSRIPGRDRRFEPAPCVTYVAHHSLRISRAEDGARLLRADVDHAICALRHVYGAELCPLVSVLRNESDSRVPAHQNLGRRKSRPRRNEVFPLHVSWKRGDAAGIPRNLSGPGLVRSEERRVGKEGGCWEW